MKKQSVTDPRLLIELERSFSQFRSKMTGDLPRYPADLKELAVAAIDSGHSRVAVAKASKVSLISLTDWRKQKSKSAIRVDKPRELVVVDESKTCLVLSYSAQIHFPSGIRMEVAVDAMTSSFISKLGAL